MESQQYAKLFEVLFEAIPAMVLIFDDQRLVHAVNRPVRNLIGSDEEVKLKRGGEVLHCIFSKDDPKGCGYGPKCKKCIVKNTAMLALDGNSIQRSKGKIELLINGEYKTMKLLVSAAPFDYNNRQMAVIIMEDVSYITELQGLLSICSACKKMRVDDKSWVILEKFIKENSEADFTHDICPECIKKLYNRDIS